MFKETYRKMNEQIFPNPRLVESVLRRPPVRRRGRWTGGLAAAAVLACLLALPALAVHVPGGYELLYALSPAAAQRLKPVQRACEDNGVRMEVVSARVEGDEARILLTLRDLTGDRVDATTDLLDSYRVLSPFDAGFGCVPAGYDPQTGTAAFLLTMTQWGGGSIVGEKLTFTLREFLSHKQVYENVPIPLDRDALAVPPVLQRVEITGGGGTSLRSYTPDGRTADVMVPAAPLPFPVEGVQLTGVGYVDGTLRLQAAFPDNLRRDNHGFFTLRDAAGVERNCDANVCFMNTDSSGMRTDYCEYIFAVSRDSLQGACLTGSFVTCDTLTEGNWQITFPLEEVRAG